jgi:hypothetical protein
VIALLDAGGEPTGLGADLVDPYDQVWNRIVAGLASNPNGVE